MGTAISSGRATVLPVGALGRTTSGNALYHGYSTCALGGSCSSSVFPSICAPLSSSAFGSSGLLNLRVNRFHKDRRAVMSVTNARLNDHSCRSSNRVVDLNDKRAVLCGVRESSVGSQVGRNRRGSVRVFVDVGGTGNTGKNGDTVLETLEQSRRLLAMQKALLKQVEERKQLYAALGRNVSDPSDQEKSYDNADMTIQKQSEQSAGAHGELSEIDNLQPDSSVVKDKSIKSSGDFLRKPGRQTPLAATWPSPVSPGMPSPSIMQGVAKAAGNPTIRSLSPIQPLSHSSSSPVVTPVPNWRPKSNPIIPPSSPRSAPDVDRPEQGAVVESQAPSPLAGPNVMNVVLVAAECAPWSKTGGLGDVVGALPKALARRGHRVMVVAPRYSNYMEAWDTSVRKVYSVAGQEMEIGYFHGYRDGVDFVFVDSPIFHAYSSNIYGGSREDVLLRMILLCKAAVEAPWHVPCGGVPYGDGNLVFIANDWHTALLPVYLQAYYQDNGLMSYTRCILVIHNLAHQGRGPISDFGKFGLPAQYADKFRLYDPIGGDHCNVFKAGFMTSHRIVTVSQGYAQEVQTREGGWGLDGVIRDHSWKLRGVVNGIDDKEWNPQIDPCLKDQGYRNYSQGNLAGKAACKAALQNELGLPARSSVPLIGFIGRLDFQKGVDIIAEAMPWMMSQDLQLVMLGTGRKDLEDMLRTFECQYKDKVRGWVGFSVKTAHRITAGVDILLMPSRFEPCGLNQLYAMRYGTIPIVHSVGGLRDTVHPFDPFAEAGTGWTFDRAEASGLIHALGNAMWTYHDFKSSWEALQKRGMAQDLSWDNAAQLYEEVLVAAKYQW